MRYIISRCGGIRGAVRGMAEGAALVVFALTAVFFLLALA